MSEKRVKFIDYNGRYPCLCHGVLTVEIEGKKVEFDDITSGGSCSFDIEGYEDVRQGRWIVGVPNKYKEYSEEINDCMNDNVPWGCCGGCL